MGQRNGSYAVFALVLSALALSAMLYTDAYSQAAQAEASAYSALTHEVGGGSLLCLNDAVLETAVQAAVAR